MGKWMIIHGGPFDTEHELNAWTLGDASLQLSWIGNSLINILMGRIVSHVPIQTKCKGTSISVMVCRMNMTERPFPCPLCPISVAANLHSS